MLEVFILGLILCMWVEPYVFCAFRYGSLQCKGMMQKIIHIVCVRVFCSFYTRIELRNEDNSGLVTAKKEKKPIIFMCNHVNGITDHVLALVCKDLFGVDDNTVGVLCNEKIPGLGVIGTFLEQIGLIFVESESPEKRKSLLENAACTLASRERNLFLFPERTNHNNNAMNTMSNTDIVFLLSQTLHISNEVFVQPVCFNWASQSNAGSKLEIVFGDGILATRGNIDELCRSDDGTDRQLITHVNREIKKKEYLPTETESIQFLGSVNGSVEEPSFFHSKSYDYSNTIEAFRLYTNKRYKKDPERRSMSRVQALHTVLEKSNNTHIYILLVTTWLLDLLRYPVMRTVRSCLQQAKTQVYKDRASFVKLSLLFFGLVIESIFVIFCICAAFYTNSFLYGCILYLCIYYYTAIFYNLFTFADILSVLRYRNNK